MGNKRSRPMFIAPLIPFWAILGIFGITEFEGTRLLAPMVVVWTLGMAALFVHVLRQALEQRRARSNR